MKHQLTLPTLYFVVTDLGKLGIGGADPQTEWGRAYDEYADCRTKDCQPARVFVMDFDVETNAFESAREVTDEFEAEFDAICAERGLAAE